MMKSKVCIVDDSLEMATAMKDFLVSEGFGVYCAKDGNEAMGVINNKAIDVIVSDVNMPGMSGRELISKLKKAKSKAPVILISADGSIDEEKTLIRSVSAVLKKPFSPEQLAGAVQKALDATGHKKV